MVSLRSHLARITQRRSARRCNADRRSALRAARRKHSAVLISLVLLNLLVVQKSFSAETNSLLTSWLAAQTNIQTWSADFVQTRTFKALAQPLTATGHVWFAEPNRFRWELGRPPQTIAVRAAQEM